jgi:predicted nucleotidyltransferase component of viral defense system
MITRDALIRAATTGQTTELNLAREYCQHLFLSAFYQQSGSEQVMFKGGTALKIAYGSPRFSEDLDFSGFSVTLRSIENWLIAATGAMEQHGLAVRLQESKSTSGGYLAKLDCQFYDNPVRILIEVSLRSQKKRARPQRDVRGQGMLITPDWLPAYTLTLLPERRLVEEKLDALLTRGKPRDYFDVYFLLRKGMITPDQKPRLAAVRQRLQMTRMNFQRELAQFLPRSHQAILKNFRQTLEAELKHHGV